jgi:hypothetical protein
MCRGEFDGVERWVAIGLFRVVYGPVLYRKTEEILDERWFR